MTAAWLIFSGSIRPSISCWSKIGRALLTVIRRVCVCLGMIFSNMLWRSISICSKLPAPRIDTGAIDRPGKVISTSRSSSSPAGSRAFILSRERWRRSAASAAWGVSASCQEVVGSAAARAGRAAAARPAPWPARLDLLALGVAHQDDRRLDQVADQALDVAADVADLGVLGGLGLHERCAHEHRQPAGDLGLAHAGRADQHDVLGRDLLAQVVGELPAPPAVPQRDRDGPLGVGLADDVAVQLGDDLAGRQLTSRSGSRSGTAVPPPSSSDWYRCRYRRRSPATRGRSRRPTASVCLTRARAAARA